MNSALHRIGIVAAGAAALLAATATESTASGGPAPQELRALNLRSVAMNHLYGLPRQTHATSAEARALRIRSEALNRRYGLDSGPGATPQELRALRLRSEALNRRYVVETKAAPRVRNTAGFDWTDAGIGAAGAVGAVVLLGAGTIAVRRRTGVHGRAATMEH
jgi:hypothetical protein